MRASRLVTRLACLALSLGLLATTGAVMPAAAQSDSVAKPAAKHTRDRHERVRAASQSHSAPIICTKGGCAPLPAHCHAETEYTWEGDPTGYQIVVCP